MYYVDIFDYQQIPVSWEDRKMFVNGKKCGTLSDVVFFLLRHGGYNPEQDIWNGNPALRCCVRSATMAKDMPIRDKELSDTVQRIKEMAEWEDEQRKESVTIDLAAAEDALKQLIAVLNLSNTDANLLIACGQAVKTWIRALIKDELDDRDKTV